MENYEILKKFLITFKKKNNNFRISFFQKIQKILQQELNLIKF